MMYIIHGVEIFTPSKEKFWFGFDFHFTNRESLI